MKVIGTALAGLMLGTTGVAGVAAASPAQTSATVQIRHQVAGCHAWSVDGNPFKATQSVRLARGGHLTITDNDVMSHRLVRVSGSHVVYALTNQGSMGSSMMGTLKAPFASGMMPHMGAKLRVTFAQPGVYTFKTVAGEDYMPGIKTTGEDNALKLVVTIR